MSFLVASFGFLGTAGAVDVATVMVAEIECASSDDGGDLYLGRGSVEEFVDAKTETYATTHSLRNLSPSKCTQVSVAQTLASLAQQCTKYFDVISVVPLVRGNAGYLYNTEHLTSRTDGYGYGYGWGAGMGFSYTDRLLLFYRCLAE
jgi:hypothetical protein